jgi:hypothetical protein
VYGTLIFLKNIDTTQLQAFNFFGFYTGETYILHLVGRYLSVPGVRGDANFIIIDLIV